MMCMEHSYVLAVEQLLNLAVPERAQYIRVLYSEVSAQTRAQGASPPHAAALPARGRCVRIPGGSAGEWARPPGCRVRLLAAAPPRVSMRP